MSSKIIFINLLIDSLWSEDNFLNKVFDVTGPETLKLSRVNEYLGRYFGSEGDMVIVPGPSDEKYVELQELNFNLPSVTFVPISIPLTNVNEFSKEVKSKCKTVDSILFAGTSTLEISLLDQLNLKKPKDWPEVELVKRLNQKDYLISLSELLSFQIPETKFITGMQIIESDSLFKSLISSGGSGVYTFPDLMRIKAWAARKNLNQEWENSKWIVQQAIDRVVDANCFGHTQSDEFNYCLIKYDTNRLSLRHDLNGPIDQKFEILLRETFEKIRHHLIDQKYCGYFGFDSIAGKDGKFYPVIDLNVRMNKSHVLLQVSRCLKFPESNISFFRLRFINNRWLNFRDFWMFLEKECDGIFSSSGNTEIIPVDWSYWNLGKCEFLMALSSGSSDSADIWDEYLKRFTESQRGQNV